MENLHLTYREVVYEIPYRNLVLMQRDKLHTVTGIKVNKVAHPTNPVECCADANPKTMLPNDT